MVLIEQITVLERPSRSLDLNPVEILWPILSSNIYSVENHYAYVASLRTAAED